MLSLPKKKAIARHKTTKNQKSFMAFAYIFANKSAINNTTITIKKIQIKLKSNELSLTQPHSIALVCM